MIKISGSPLEPESISEQYPPGSLEQKMVSILSSSQHTYSYSSRYSFQFELELRKSIVNAALELYRSGMSFRIFRHSVCNTRYWQRTDEGGFLLKEGVEPAEAVWDIFVNGRKYATECSTAIVIVYYKSVLDIFTEQAFNDTFPGIYLMNWQDLDSDLGIVHYRNPGDFLPGDCRYFKNPDVDPATPEWQGENTIDLGDGTYYGHGLGIQSADGIIESLNEHRIEGSQVSSYLMDTATRPDFEGLAEISQLYS